MWPIAFLYPIKFLRISVSCTTADKPFGKGFVEPAVTVSLSLTLCSMIILQGREPLATFPGGHDSRLHLVHIKLY